MIRKCKEKLIESEAALICSSHQYISSLLIQLQTLKNPGVDIGSIESEASQGLVEEKITPVQRLGSDLLAGMIESGLFGSELAVFVLPPDAAGLEEPTVIMSSDDNYIFRELPPGLEDIIEMNESENRPFRARVDLDNSYELMPDGISAVGLDGEYLVTAFKFRPTPSMGEIWYFDFTPIQEELSSVDSFYQAERRNINRNLILVGAVTLIALIIISFFILSYLIRKKITRPIDELAMAAEEVMAGNLEMEVPVRKGEEFEKLKLTFNEMLAGLRNILHISSDGIAADRHSPAEEPSDKKKEITIHRWGRLSILVQMTILICALFIAAGGSGFALFLNSQSRLVEKSKEKLIQSEARLISTGHDFLANTIVEILKLQGVTGDISQEQFVFFQAVMNRTLCPAQVHSNMLLEDMIENGLLGTEAAVIVSPIVPGAVPEPLVVMSNDDEYIYMEVPESLVELAELPAGSDEPYRKRIDGGNSYMLVENGVPEMGITGRQLVASYLFIPDPEAKPLWLFDFKPMDEEINSLDSYYSLEKRKADIFLGLVSSGFLILLALITFFILSYLIRTRITRPIDELAGIAEQIMDGNLDVEVSVRKGEEFEGIKTAFNEMLKSLRDIIEKSTNH
ncbi:MAG: HAMP domain-containing protein [Actinobacteria bacterium]|nr:HAMP domain-containing protein [Actinomycetota bacterium]